MIIFLDKTDFDVPDFEISNLRSFINKNHSALKCKTEIQLRISLKKCQKNYYFFPF